MAPIAFPAVPNFGPPPDRPLSRVELNLIILITITTSIACLAITAAGVFNFIRAYKTEEERAMQKVLRRFVRLRPQEQYEEILRFAKANNIKIAPRPEYFEVCRGDLEYRILERMRQVPWNEQYLEFRRICLERNVPFDDSDTWRAILHGGPAEWEDQEDDGYATDSDGVSDEDYEPSEVADEEEEKEDEGIEWF